MSASANHPPMVSDVTHLNSGLRSYHMPASSPDVQRLSERAIREKLDDLRFGNLAHRVTW